ncbi:PilN domain-containing protein [Legionella tunisiensis]|uniref:PilN domain-containing protein n=1 Tax=Legionella tunisiensis TaxID=1034944 RepID=UPI000362A755|nr:PilN domain-containing protein [Legionella tunisiensis]
MRHLALTRILLFHLFNELNRVMPDDAYLAGVKKSHDTITLAGYSATSHSVVSLIRNLEKKPFVKVPVWIEIKKIGWKK